MATPVVLTTGARPIVPVESGGVPMTPVDTLGEPVTVVDTLGEPVVLINEDGTPAFLAYSAKTYLGGVAPYHWLDFIANRALYASVDVGNVTGATGYTFTRASDGYYENSDGTLTLFGSGALRRGDRGVLIEGSRTNVVLRSEDFSNAAWGLTTATLTTGIDDPASGTTACTLTATSANGQILQGIGGSLGTGTNYTVSVYLRRRTGTGDVWVFNPNAGGITTVTLTSSWRRFSVTGLGAAATNSVGVRLATSGDAVDIAFSQLEAASFPSSYVKSEAAAATRAADVLSYTAGVSYGLSLWAEFVPNAAIVTQSALFASDGTSNNEAAIRLNTGGNPTYFSVSGGVLQSNVSVGTAIANTTYKLAARFATDSVRGALDGVLGAADTSATNPATPTVLNVGSSRTGTEQLFGLIRRIAVFNSALTDAQLQTTTT